MNLPVPSILNRDSSTELGAVALPSVGGSDGKTSLPGGKARTSSKTGPSGASNTINRAQDGLPEPRKFLHRGCVNDSE